MVYDLLKLFEAHFIGDFAFQTEWMALGKGKSWEILFYHTAVYTAAIFLFLGIRLSLLAVLVILLSHFIIDTIKARWRIIKSIGFDQLLHSLILIFIYFL